MELGRGISFNFIGIRNTHGGGRRTSIHISERETMTTKSLAGGSPLKQPTLIITNSARFDIGLLVATPGAMVLLEHTGFSAAALVGRHMLGDWGDCGKEDAASNEYAVNRRMRLLSVYRLVDPLKLAATAQDKRSDLATIWIITEADRSVTTLLRPEDY